MTPLPDAVLAWVIPAVVVFGVTAVAIAVAVWSVRRARRSPRARARAEADRTRAGSALVRLDDAVGELDLEVGLSGALYDGEAPAALRRARMIAQHVRDEAFESFRELDDAEPVDVRRVSARIRTRAEEALGVVAGARAAHDEWMRAHRSAVTQVDAAGARLERLRTELGDPGALVADLAGRFDDTEWQQAAVAARTASAALASAQHHLEAARSLAADPTRSAFPELSVAERELRRAESSARALEESHRLVTDAAHAVPQEIDAARAAVAQGMRVREGLEPADAERLGRELRAVTDELDRLTPVAARHPTATVTAIARLRARLDLALGDARTAQQRLRGARTALPGTLASARGALARAEVAVAGAGADARVRLDAAQRELAGARRADDPVEALDAARRAQRLAEDAQALADYARLKNRPPDPLGR
ncbi:hypothetical protein QNO21_00185 [Microbacterium sp. zg-Y818]|uniref:hypothetical protein n=1 Tax=unclassified Microbacterium TaxID=2609290 RepID=UPI00214C80A2|nr:MULTISPECIES: hypothetical protein [unclassified Microbacterium]MCR2801939.1 hypothetical protein [Microbacterium sp. zg.Y818]WIM22495.1 hypothetical protein QNO21_00185 [Microbacterium sp. zg-Y818]